MPAGVLAIVRLVALQYFPTAIQRFSASLFLHELDPRKHVWSLSNECTVIDHGLSILNWQPTGPFRGDHVSCSNKLEREKRCVRRRTPFLARYPQTFLVQHTGDNEAFRLTNENGCHFAELLSVPFFYCKSPAAVR